mmetsp:Transcript_16986/g.66230  ORF Transcript_16986/g.66230 Transcript_16986/m.66230 type:complete len:352 (+) Transcript_16986:1065-2120(+)
MDGVRQLQQIEHHTPLVHAPCKVLAVQEGGHLETREGHVKGQTVPLCRRGMRDDLSGDVFWAALLHDLAEGHAVGEGRVQVAHDHARRGQHAVAPLEERALHLELGARGDVGEERAAAKVLEQDLPQEVEQHLLLAVYDVGRHFGGDELHVVGLEPLQRLHHRLQLGRRLALQPAQPPRLRKGGTDPPGLGHHLRDNPRERLQHPAVAKIQANVGDGHVLPLEDEGEPPGKDLAPYGEVLGEAHLAGGPARPLRLCVLLLECDLEAGVPALELLLLRESELILAMSGVENEARVALLAVLYLNRHVSAQGDHSQWLWVRVGLVVGDTRLLEYDPPLLPGGSLAALPEEPSL